MRRALVTGATSGIGREAACALAENGWMVEVHGRDAARAEATARALGGRPLVADLASLADVRRAAAALCADGLRLDALVCNAGVQELGPPSVSADGFELTFAVNHLSTFVLVAELGPLLTHGGRVVIVTSGTHDPDTREGRFNPPAPIDVGALASPTTAAKLSGIRRYTTSKLCNVLFASELARRAPHLSVTAFDPGAVPGTGLTRGWGRVLRAIAGNRTLLRALGVETASPAAAGAALAEVTQAAHVAPYTRLGIARDPAKSAQDPAVARRLWEDTQALLDRSLQIGEG